MGGVKRKEAPSGGPTGEKKQKVTDRTHTKTSKPSKPSKPSRLELAAKQNDEDDEDDGDQPGGVAIPGKDGVSNQKGQQLDSKQFKLDTSSAEAHAKQRALAKERKAAKPNADAIQRSKQLWERLRRKSHVPLDERKELVAELFELIDGRVRDFVFKHDSVRVIQCAVKYAKADQLKRIVQELKGDVRDLVESRYGKFLVAKMVVQGDREDKNAMVPEFYGHVKRLINHPEASWIVDDIYRQVATPQQKALMLREWYGPEFALLGKQKNRTGDEEATADLSKILQEAPEKRRPILHYLHQMINNLIQKKMTGFTMLHDAMLQYFLALSPGSEEHSDFLETLKGDIDEEEVGGGGDLYRNLAFTKDGSRLVCLALAYGSSKDRKSILKCFKDNVETMIFDAHAKMVLVTGLEVQDDTKTSYKAVLQEMLGSNLTDSTQRLDRLESILKDLNARIPVLHILAGSAKWLVKDHEKALIAEMHKIRESTSKKAPEQRRKELIGHISAPLLELVAERAANLAGTSFGCQATTEILLECDAEARSAAKKAVAELAAGDPNEEAHIANDSAASRMLKSLVLGGPFDPVTKKVQLSEPALGFAEALYPVVKPHLADWACGDSSFVVVALLESDDVDAAVQQEVKMTLKKAKARLQAAAADGSAKAKRPGEKEEQRAKKEKRGNAGARILLGKL